MKVRELANLVDSGIHVYAKVGNDFYISVEKRHNAYIVQEYDKLVTDNLAYACLSFVRQISRRLSMGSRKWHEVIVWVKPIQQENT